MTTKPAPSIAEFAADSLEKIAYQSVADIATREPNGRNRLGYQVWAWLKGRKGTLIEAVKASGSLTVLSAEEVTNVVADNLRKHGIKEV